MKSQIKIGSILSYVSVLLNIIIGFMISPLTVRELGSAQYGLYQLIWSFVGYMAVLDFGFTNAVIRYVAKYRAEKDKKSEENFLAMVLIIYVAISLLVLLVGRILYANLWIIFKTSLSGEEIILAKQLFSIMLINMTASITLNIFQAVINGYERFVFQRGLTVIKLVTRAGLTAALLLTGHKSIALAITDTVLVLLFFAIQIFYSFFVIKIKIKLHRFEWRFFKEISSYSFFIFLAMFVDQANWKVDQFIIGIKKNAEQVGVYSIALQFPYYFMSFAGALSGVFLPKASKMEAQKESNDQFTDLMIQTARIQWAVLGILLLGFAFFGKQFIQLWVGKSWGVNSYVDSCYQISLMIMIALFIPLLQSVGLSIQQAKNKHYFRSVVYLIIAVINVLLTYYLVDTKLGITGAAVGTVISFLIGNILIMNLYYQFRLGINVVRFFGQTAKGLLLSTALACGVGWLINRIPGAGWDVLILRILLFAIAYAMATYIVGLNGKEKQLFGKSFTGLMTKLKKA